MKVLVIDVGGSHVKLLATGHRKRRELRDFTSELSAIPGVGEKRKTRLLRQFGSI